MHPEETFRDGTNIYVEGYSSELFLTVKKKKKTQILNNREVMNYFKTIFINDIV